MKNLFKAAHKMTRKMVAEYKDIDYKAQFALCLVYLQKNKEEEEMNLEELKKDLEVQIKEDFAIEENWELKIWEKGNMKRAYLNHAGLTTGYFFKNQENKVVFVKNNIRLTAKVGRDARDFAEYVLNKYNK